VHLVDFVIRTYHDAQSSECQNRTVSVFDRKRKRRRRIVSEETLHNIGARLRSIATKIFVVRGRFRNWFFHRVCIGAVDPLLII